MEIPLTERLHNWSTKKYIKYLKKNHSWNISQYELLDFPEETLGFELGSFLSSNDFEMHPQLEDHDVFHVLTKTGTSVTEEIGMQFYLFGNGKKSLYLFVVIVLGTLFYPIRFSYFLNQYEKGKTAHYFHYIDFSKMLYQHVSTIRQTFKIL
jgi:ubiquinone biosynthesis protein Coq4